MIMAALTNEQIEQKKQQLAEIMKEAKALQEELMEAGAIPMDDDELDGVAGGRTPIEVYLDPKAELRTDYFGLY
jgi:hypothetical protein